MAEEEALSEGAAERMRGVSAWVGVWPALRIAARHEKGPIVS